MKNDLDFIKDKFENSGVKAPYSFGEGFALDAIKDIEPVCEMKNPGGRLKKITAVAASVAVAVSVLTIAIILFNSNNSAVKTEETAQTTAPDDNTVSRTYDAKTMLYHYNSYKDICMTMKELNDDYNSYYEGEDSNSADEIVAGSSGGSSSGSGNGGSDYEAFSKTYRQEENVDEGDIVKNDGKNIYCADNSGTYGTIKVFVPNSNKEISINIRKSIKESINDTTTINYLAVSELYAGDGRLIVICDVYFVPDVMNDKEVETSAVYAVVYDVSDINNITAVDMMGQSGDFTASRMIGSKLYVVSNYSHDEYTDFSNENNLIPRSGKKGELKKLTANKIYSFSKAQNCDMTVISAFDTKYEEKDIDTHAVIGTANIVYCSEKNIYLTDCNYSRLNSENRYTNIVKISLKDNLEFVAGGTVGGTVENQYWMDERNGYLRVVSLDLDVKAEHTKLTVLDENMKNVGSVGKIAKGEECKAVRFLDDTAYIITYRNTDPLFAVSLKNPKKPKLLGAVEISGFSSMIVPVGKNKVLGIGYSESRDGTVENKLKLVLFDVSDPMKPKVADTKKINKYSNVMDQPRALVYNPERGDYIIPLESSGEETQNGGILNFKIENGKIKIIRQYTNNDPTLRCVYIGDKIYLIPDPDRSTFQLDSVEYK